jgi:hypothetical protein
MTDEHRALRALIASVGPQEGWEGEFTRGSYPGAWEPGTRVVKVRGAPDDAHQPGEQGVVLGSIGHPVLGPGYFLEWDDMPRRAVFTIGTKLARVA